MGTREIADALFLSPETVNSHVKNVLKKLGVHSRAAAVEAASLLRTDVLV
jgi:DNA-binding CsgD family transcriptional regulator